MEYDDNVSDKDEFGRHLRAAICSIAGMTGKDFASVESIMGQKIGVKGGTIRRYKEGHIPPEPEAVYKLAMFCVEEGHLDRAWMSGFLQSAGYPRAQAALAEKWPA